MHLREERPGDRGGVDGVHRAAFGDFGDSMVALVGDLREHITRHPGLSLVAYDAARGVPLVFVEGDPACYARLGFVGAVGLGFRKPSLRIPNTPSWFARYARTRRGWWGRSCTATPSGSTTLWG